MRTQRAGEDFSPFSVPGKESWASGQGEVPEAKLEARWALEEPTTHDLWEEDEDEEDEEEERGAGRKSSPREFR